MELFSSADVQFGTVSLQNKTKQKSLSKNLDEQHIQMMSMKNEKQKPFPIVLCVQYALYTDLDDVLRVSLKTMVFYVKFKNDSRILNSSSCKCMF